MTMESFDFVSGTQSFHVQFDIVAPVAATLQQPGPAWGYMPKLRYTVANVRIVETTLGLGDRGSRMKLDIARSFRTAAEAAAAAAEYAKRIVRNQMASKPLVQKTRG